MSPDQAQDVFRQIYRGRQSALHHAAYMRVGKVVGALEMLKRVGFSTGNRDVFDYGFGAGTLFRTLPRDARLFGVEIDEENVAAVRQMLRERGYPSVDLQPICLESWASHPLLSCDYDLFVCSHVLEHLPDPVEFLRHVRRCIRPGGIFLGLLPINERTANPHHLHRVTRDTIVQWGRSAGYDLTEYLEDEPWIYWVQPLFSHDAGWRYRVAQAVSLLLGVTATLLGFRLWHRLSKPFAVVTGSRPTQAVFILVPMR